MSKHKPSQRLLAMALSIVMVLGMTPVTAMAQTTTDIIGEIIAFEALSEETANREVSLGISLEDLNLPGALNATVRVAVETDEEESVRDSGEPKKAAAPDPQGGNADSGDMVSGNNIPADEQEPTVATPSEAQENQPVEDGEQIAGENTDSDEVVQSTTGSAVTLGESGTQDEPKQSADTEFMEMNIPVPVTWVSAPDYDGDKAGIYTFTAKIEGFTVRAELPKITVTVGTPAGVVTAFAPLADEIRWQSVAFGTAQENLNLPGTLSATVEGETADVPVTWAASPAYDATTKGLYLFTAQLAEGWSATAELPHIAVVVRAEQPKITLFSFGGGAKNDDPFLIGTAAQLAEIATLTNQGELEEMFLGTTSGTVYLKLDNDIDLSGYTKDGGWTPIGTDAARFGGSFDGSGNTIANLVINRSDGNYQGLFGAIGKGGTVQNLGVVNANVIGNNHVGGVVGSIGADTGKESTVQNCYSTGAVSGFNYVGGVAGIVNSQMQSCYSTAAVSGNRWVGGIAGRLSMQASDTSPTIKNCAALNPRVSGTEDVGRIVGYIQGGAVATLTGNIAFGGMAVTVNGSPKSGIGNAGSHIDGLGKTATDLKADGTLGGLFPNNSNPWTTGDGKLPGFGAAVDMPAHIIDIPAGQFFNGEGTSEKPYEIATPQQLAKLAELVNDSDTNEEYGKQGVHYKLMNDLDLSGIDPNGDDTGWVPIGTAAKQFKGSFDGGGHTISNLTINRSGSNYQGLYGYIGDGGTVKNLGMVNVDIKGNDYVGGVVGYVYGSVENCYSTGRVSGNHYVGGVAGDVYGGSVINCYSTGRVSGTSFVGGVAGPVVLGGSVENCYSTGAVSGTNNVGGVAGSLEYSGKVQNCVALNPSISGTGNNVGRVAGKVDGGNVLSGNIAFDGMTVTVNGQPKLSLDEGGGKIDGLAKTAADIQGWTSDFWTNSDNWNTENGAAVWSTDNWQFADGKLPILKDTDGNVLPGQSAALPDHLAAEGAIPFEGAGTSESYPYLIKTAADLARLAELVNGGNNFAGKHFRLENNLDLSGIDPNGNSTGWVPIGQVINGSYSSFKGSFDGGGHVITGLTIKRPDSDYQGLFGYAEQATISNLGIVGADITGGYSVGGVAGVVYGSVENCYVTGAVSGTDRVGGVVGYLNGTVGNCYVTGAVSGTVYSVGGVAGHIESGTVQNCYSTGSVSGNDIVGGVAGVVYGTNATVKNCVALNSEVSSSRSNVGRVAGRNQSGTVQNNYAYSGIPGTWSSMGLSENGTPLSSAMLFGENFWTTAGNWNTAAWSAENWEFADGKLPILKGTDGNVMPGQSGAPDLYLLNLSTDKLSITLSGAMVSGNGSDIPYTTVAHTQFRPIGDVQDQITIAVSGMEDWTEPNVTITVKKADSDSDIATAKESNSCATFSNPPNFSGNITITAQSDSNPNNKTTVTLTVNKRVLTEASFGVADGDRTKTYNGAAQALDYTLDSVGMSFPLKYNGAAIAPTNAGTYRVTADITEDTVYSGVTGLDLGNFTITPKPITITGVTATHRTYDGTTSVELVGGTLDGVVSSDSAKVNFTLGNGTIENANAGDGKAVTTNIQLTGTAAGNYTLTQPGDITVDIAKKELTPASATVLNKEYDGTDTATVNSVTFTGLVDGETLTLGTDYTAIGKFHDAIAAGAKTVTVTPTLSSTTKADNYSLSGTPYYMTADITHKAITGTVSIGVMQGGSGDANRIDEGDTLTANTSSIIGTVAGNATLSYQWYRNGTAISGATASTYTVAARATDPASSLITVKVTGTGNYSGDKTSAAVEIGRIPLGGSVSIDGTPNLSHTLALNTALLTPSSATTSVQWLRDGTAISGAIGNNYAITKADLGKSISVSVTGTGEYSGTKTAEISISAVVPETPTNFSASAGNGQVTLSWTAPFDGGSALTKYQLSKDDGANWQDIGVVTTYTVTGLTNGTEYTFKLRAVNSEGEGAEASATATPVRPSSGGSGGGSYTPPAPPATPAPQWLEQSGTSQAISDAKEQGTSQILTRASGQYGVRQATWAAFVGHQFWHDTMDGNAVQVRTYIKNPTALTTDLLVSGYVKGVEVEQTKALFERFFANKVRTIHMDQTGVWGQTIELAAKVDLTGMDITKLYIYSYDKATNTYRRIEKPAYWVDTNGYLHFYTALAGDIIISEGPLARIENGAK